MPLPLLRESLHLQPVDAVARPGMPLLGVPFARAQAHAVRALLIDVQIKWHPGLLQRLGKLEAVLQPHSSVLERVPDETGRRVFGHVELIGQLANQLRRRVLAQQIVPRSPDAPIRPC